MIATSIFGRAAGLDGAAWPDDVDSSTGEILSTFDTGALPDS
jgi:hypothetical protein